MMQQPEVMLINAPSPRPAKERVPAIKYQHHLASHQEKSNMEEMEEIGSIEQG